MPRPQAWIFIAVALVVLVVVLLLPQPWNDVASAALMLAVFWFALVQERATGRSSGVVKWLALGLAAFDVYQIITFLTNRP